MHISAGGGWTGNKKSGGKRVFLGKSLAESRRATSLNHLRH